MQENAKCFIKIKKGIYEEITYKELQERIEKNDTYKNKKFIYLHKMLMEVNEEEFVDYYHEIERNRYAERVLKNLTAMSIDEIKNDEEFRDKEVFADENANTEKEVMRIVEIGRLQEALMKLSNKEYQLIKDLFFSEKTLTECAKDRNVHIATIYTKKQRILAKLKKFLKN